MFRRHSKLSDFIISLDDAEIDLPFLNASDNHRVDKLVKPLVELYAVMKKSYIVMMQPFVLHDFLILFWRTIPPFSIVAMLMRKLCMIHTLS